MFSKFHHPGNAVLSFGEAAWSSSPAHEEFPTKALRRCAMLTIPRPLSLLELILSLAGHDGGEGKGMDFTNRKWRDLGRFMEIHMILKIEPSSLRTLDAERIQS